MEVNERRVCELFAEAEQFYNEGDVAGAVHNGQQAIESFRKLGDEDAATDAIHLVVKALAGQGKHKEASNMAKAESKRVRQSGNKRAEAKMLLSVADARWDKNGQQAVQAAAEARGLFHDMGDTDMEIAALLSLATAQLQRSKGAKPNANREGLEAAMLARQMCRDIKHRRGEAEALHVIAVAYAQARSFQDCLQAADEAADAYLELKDKRMEAFEVLSMASWKLQAGKPEQAIADAEDALGIYRMLDSHREVDAASVLFTALLECGQAERAHALASEAMARLQEGSRCKRSEACLLQLMVDFGYREVERQLLAGPSALGTCEGLVGLAERCLALRHEVHDRVGESRLLVTLSALYFRLERFDDAVRAGERARALTTFDQDQEVEEPDQGQAPSMMPDLFTLIGPQLNNGAHEEALTVATKMRDYFRKIGDGAREASALLTVCSAQLKLGNLDQAAVAAKRARMLFSEEEDAIGRGESMRLLLEVHWKKGEFRPAVQVSERACVCFREAGDQKGEANMQYTLAHSAVCLAEEEGAAVDRHAKGYAALSRAAKDALAKALEAAKRAVELCRSLAEDGVACLELLACSLGVLARVLMLHGQPEDSLAAADEAVVLFRECGDYAGEGSAMLASAESLYTMGRYEEGAEAVEEALELCSQHGDERGARKARELLSQVQYITPSAAELLPPERPAVGI